jgi:aminomethyltransferase
MGEVHVEGAGAEAFINLLVTNNVSRLVDGQAQYTVMCQDDGGVIDDLLVYRRGPSKYLLCINAGNIDKDYAWIEKQAKNAKDVTVKNMSDEYCQIAIQGPKATQILQSLTKVDLSAIKYYCFAETQDFLGAPAILSRTGYTGEDGFEIYAPTKQAVKIWDALLEVSLMVLSLLVLVLAIHFVLK